MQVIIPGEPTKFALRLVAYEPNRDRLGVLPQHNGFELGDPLNDVPSLKVTYPDGGLNANLIAGHCEVAVEYAANGGPWVEPPNARFLRIKRSGDSIDRAGSRSYDLPGWAWLLRKVVLYPNGAMVDGKRQFNAVSAGAILLTFIQEGKARGALSGLTYNFSDTRDSDNKEWDSARRLTLAIEPGKDLLSVLINLSEQGVLDWRMQGRELQVFNPDTVLGTDRASGPSPVDLRLGRDITEAPDTGTLEDAVSAILIGGEAGLSVEVTNPAAVAPWGRWETYQSQSGVSDAGTARLLGQNALERVGRERVQVTRGLMLDLARWLPFEHYQPGDYLLAPGDGGAMESLRLRQITLSVGTDGQVGGNVVLNDRFLEREIRLARQAAGILGGGVGSGGSGGEPAPETNNRIPAAPQGLVVAADAYLDEHGYARGQATVTWNAVAADVNGVALSIDSYEVYARRDLPGELWLMVAQTASGDTKATVSPLVVGWEYAWKVRAVSAGVKGDFSGQVVELVPDDTTPPPVPTAPQLSTRLGVIHAAWDGRGVGGAVMPTDFDRLRIWMDDPLTPEPAIEVGYLDAAGSIVVPGEPYGADRTFWFTSVDRSANESGPSASATIATQPLVDADLIGQIIDGAEHIIDGTIPGDAKITADSITGRLIRALAIEADKIAANAITADKIAAGSIQAGHISANAITAEKIAANAITAAKIAADAINGKTITGSVIRTGATGQRIVIDPSTLDIRFYPDGNTNYSRLWTSDDDFAGEATFRITSGTNPGMTARTYFTLAAGWTKLEVLNPNNSNANGGFLESAEDYSRIGYENDTSDNQYMWFDASGMTTHYGKWWDNSFASNTWGVHAGSRIASDGWTGMEIKYGPTMQGNMGPVAVLRDGAMLNNPNLRPNFYWCIEFSTQTSFMISWSDGGGVRSGKGIYWWAHRHNGSA
ncbi:phage tail protein [Nonomuraea gerenzanensis]|uniref:fibronectin type III domain-containing protein n=1 Tax=Nonomuraea gerenzanensis TaxID=93944 RepID=UPI001CDA3F30|nr:fibronectin type III domain-containing protein [Nonomuraea gerenzanensis]UBU16685.1 hypothetical protein LCN96_17200 [Nonomuraea gerenzanensis]